MFRSTKNAWLDKEITRTERRILESQFGSEDYVKLIQYRIQLDGLKSKLSPSVSKETLVLAGTNLLGIILILKHEHVNVISSKAMSLLMKVR